MVVALETLIEKSIKNMGSGIHKVVKETAIELIKRAYKEEIYVQITSGYRSFAEQTKLYNQGRTDRSKPIVTNAKAGQSNHNYGLAIDYVLVSEDGKKAIWTVNKDWKRVAAIGKSLGFKWGGDWTSFKDNPHLEMMGGLTIKDLQNGKRPTLKSKVKAVPAAVKEVKKETVKPAVKIKVSSKPIVKYPGILLKEGAKGMNRVDIERIQRACGMTEKSVSGKFDGTTTKAVKAYQKKQKLDVDGIVGENTWNRMF